MTITEVEQEMSTTVRAENPEPGIWQNPGPGPLDPEVWLSLQQTANLLMSRPKYVRKYLVGRVPHIATLSGKPIFHIDLIMAIRGQLLQGNALNQALVNLGIEPDDETERA